MPNLGMSMKASAVKLTATARTTTRARRAPRKSLLYPTWMALNARLKNCANGYNARPHTLLNTRQIEITTVVISIGT